MCKNLKIKFIITIIAIIFLALVIPSITNKCLARARGSENFTDGLWKDNNISNGGTDWDSAVKEKKVHISSSFFEKNYVFCIQRGQEIHFNKGFPEYTISEKYKIDGNNSDVLNGFAYILNSNDTFTRTAKKSSWGNNYAWTWYQDDPVQLAVWAYVKNFRKSLNSELGLNKTQTGFPDIKDCDIKIDNEEKRIYAKKPNKKGHVPGTNDYYGAGEESSRTAYALYSYAVALQNGTASDTNNYSAEIRILTHEAEWKDNEGKTHSEYQRLMLVESTSYKKSSSISLRIYKQDNFGDSLAGAKINITKGENIKTMKIHNTPHEELTLTSEDGDGCFVINNNEGYKSIKIIPNNTNQDSVELKLNEIEAPDGYTKLIGNITITIKFKKNNDKLIIEKITVDPNDNVTFKIGDDGIGRIYIKNQSHVIEDGLEIIKTDTSGKNKLANAEFQFYFCWAKSVTLNGKTYTLDDISTKGKKIENAGKVFSSGNGVYYEYKKDNLIFIRPENEEGKLRPIMYIQKLKTDNSGKIIFDKIITTDSSSNRVLVTVTETSAPEGYQCLGEDKHIYLELNINESGDGWQLIERTDEGKINDDEIKSYFTLDQNNLTLKLINNSDSLTNVKLYKEDVEENSVKDAEFTVTLTNVKSIQKNGETLKDGDSDGIITFDATSNSSGLIANIPLIEPKNDNQVTMKIEEKVAGEGTAKMPDLEFTFNKDESTGKWSLNPTNNTKNKYKKYYKQAVDELTLTLVDDLGIDELKIIKLDAATEKPLKGAKFKITATNVSGINSTPYTTDDNGTIDLSKVITITDPTKVINLTIEETEAAENHYLMSPNPVNITLKRIENSNNYTISGEHAKYASCKDGVITIELKDDSKKVSGLNIKKVDKTGKYNVKDAEFQLFFNQIESIKFVGDDKTYTLAEIREKPTVSVGDGDYMSNGSVYKMRTTGGYTLISPIRDDGDADRLFIEGLKTNDAGEINSIEYVVASEENKTIYFNIKETKTSSGWDILPGTVRLLLHYDSTSHKWETYKKTEENLKKFNQKLDKSYYNSELDDYVNINEDNLNITLKDDYKIDKFSIVKTDSQNNEKISGAKFNVTLNNIKSVLDYKINSNGSTTLKNIPGNTVFKDLVIKDPNESVVITIEETNAPRGYKRMEGKIRITLTRDGSTFKINEVETIGTVLEKEFVEGNATYSNNSLTVGIKDIPIMNLGGIVWEDSQSGIKDVGGPDGKFNNEEEGMSGIGVEVYKIVDGNETLVTKDVYGQSLMDTSAEESDSIKYALNNGGTDTITLAKGEYIFPNLEKGTYIIKFLYNGINYKTVERCDAEKLYEYAATDKVSKVTEVGRDAFNARFKTISKGQSNDGTKLGYDYDAEKKISKLQVGTKGENPANGNKADFQMTAVSSNYLRSGDTNWKDVWTSKGKIKRDHYALDINCGLTEKYFDLSLGTDVKSARVTINGKEKTYTYAQVMDGALEDLTLDGKTQNNSSGTEYTLYLYYSDYNFRIDDYKTDMNGGITNKVNDKDDDNVNYDDLKELEVYVTYSIILKNQSKHEGTVEKFDYYYDSKYTIYEIPALEDYTVERNDNEHKITFTHKGTSTLNNENDYRRGIEVTFKVNKDEQGYVKTGDFSNAGEITVYSTPTGGVIDYDSAPDNAEISTSTEQKKITRNFEDDCDEAPGLKISVGEDLVRKISGNVFEDLKEYNGNKDTNDPDVNNVIVQLIEIKKINGKNYEYIWQETRSGRNQVKTTERNGYVGKSYNNSLTEADTGKYEFKDFIPGNYIIRFIYGDGTTYDLTDESTDEIKKYNGQDYKSTIDEHYKEEWYDSTKYTGTSSVAVDNEARRLEVMAYSTTVNKEIGEAIDEKNNDMLDATWMCAETSKIYVPVDMNEGSDTTEDSNKIMFTKDEHGLLILPNINFGLALRPKTKLVLEKHITSLKITPQGTGVQPIVEASLDINDILGINDISSNDAKGSKQNLAIIKSTRTERGFWKVETDIEELAQGAKVELEYTYVIKNEGENDYLSSDVIGEYREYIGKDINNNDTDDYVEYLKDASGTAKSSIKGQRNNYGNYLGQYYYKGEKGANDVSVLSTVTKIEDNLNNNLKFVNTTNPSFTSKNGGEKVVYNADGNDNKEKIETVLENIESFATLESGKRDTSKTAKLETTLAATKEGIRIPTYLEEITEYTNAAGRKDMESTPANLGYVHSEDTTKTMENSNEVDEFWGETIIVSKPTGEDKQTPVQAIIIATTAIATIGVGIILIKKFVLKK